MAIEITPQIAIDEDEISERFVRASGPGGQHVNKTSSAVELRFDAANSPNLPEDLKARLRNVAGSRMTEDGVIILFAQGHRSQQLNREDAQQRLVELLAKAAFVPKKRRPTKPTKASKERRLEGKAVRSKVKVMRGRPGFD